jgi:hypothetical protein
MIVQLDWRYKFLFEEPFNKLDGVYAVTKIYAYDELIRDKIDLTKLYTSVGLTEVEFNTDLPLIRTKPVYNLEHVRDPNNVILIPEHLIVFEPDASVRKYYNSVVTWNIGAFPDKEQLSAAQDVISQLIERLFGTEQNPIILDIGVMWLTDHEYEDIVNERKTKQDAAFNWFSENQRIRDENMSLRAKCIELENIILNHVN